MTGENTIYASTSKTAFLIMSLGGHPQLVREPHRGRDPGRVQQPDLGSQGQGKGISDQSKSHHHDLSHYGQT
jgi:hypothetical protein